MTTAVPDFWTLVANIDDNYYVEDSRGNFVQLASGVVINPKNDLVKDMQAFTNAFTVLSVLGGGYIDVAQGHCQLSSLSVPPGIPFKICGTGDATILTFNGAETAIDIQGPNNIEICNLKINGNFSRGIYLHGANTGISKIHDLNISGANQTPTVGAVGAVVVDTANDVWIYNNLITGCGVPATKFGYNIVTGFNTAGNRLRIFGNKIDNANASIGIVIFDGTYCEIVDNYVDMGGAANHLGDNASGYGIAVYGHIVIDHNIVSLNRVKNSAGTGIYIQGSESSSVIGNIVENTCLVQTEGPLAVGGIASNYGGVTISGNVVRTSGQNGIVVTNLAGGKGSSVVGNLVTSCTLRGIKIEGWNGGVGGAPTKWMSVTGNVVDNATQHGIEVVLDARYCTINGNTVKNCGNTGILLSPESIECVVVGNTIDTCTNQGIGIKGKRSKALSNNVANCTAGTGIDSRGQDCSVIGNMVTGCLVGLNEDATSIRCIWTLNDASTGNGTAFTQAGTDGTYESNKYNATAGSKLSGTGVLVAGTVNVVNPEIKLNDKVILSRIIAGGVLGHLSSACVAGTLTVNSSSATDTSTVYWQIEH